VLYLVYIVHVLGILSFAQLIFIGRFLTGCALVAIATTHHEESVPLVLTREVTVDISFWLLAGVLVVTVVILQHVFIGLHVASLPEVVLLDFVSVELDLVLSELLKELRDIVVNFYFALWGIGVLILVILRFKVPLGYRLLDRVLLFDWLHELVLIVLLLESGGYLEDVEPALLGILVMPLHPLCHLLGAISVSQGTLLVLDLFDAALSLYGLYAMSCGRFRVLFLIVPLEDALQFLPKRDFLLYLVGVGN